MDPYLDAIVDGMKRHAVPPLTVISMFGSFREHYIAHRLRPLERKILRITSWPLNRSILLDRKAYLERRIVRDWRTVLQALDISEMPLKASRRKTVFTSSPLASC
jgi:hypothetical protein